jgi:hypothetical protein
VRAALVQPGFASSIQNSIDIKRDAQGRCGGSSVRPVVTRYDDAGRLLPTLSEMASKGSRKVKAPVSDDHEPVVPDFAQVRSLMV